MSYRVPIGATVIALGLAAAGVAMLVLAVRARMRLHRFRRPGVRWWNPELQSIDRPRSFEREGAPYSLRATRLGWSGLGLLMLALIVWLAMQAL